ncbi:MAG: 3,4-dihydroxy-2-butanone-4-phosphate synthase [Candidatus Omnitrophica bacterium]|nr:3,4-dihydroxy-2-butanone-4-phosphate synthase [Candidatus Omnitrophota bacterium]
MFNTIGEVLEDLKDGKMIIVMDDEGRENEGDLLCAAQHITPEIINFMAKEARGLVCVPMEANRLDELDLHPMKIDHSRKHQKCDTGWAISVDAAKGITTGISAADRAYTVNLLIDPKTKPTDIITPGHLFPLRALRGGVLVRAGHTEASVDLTRLAGLYPAGVICEIMNEDGTMARTNDLIEFSKRHALKICTIDSLIEHMTKYQKLVERGDENNLSTEYGEFRVIKYHSKVDDLEHIVLIYGNINKNEPTLVRVHAENILNDVFQAKGLKSSGALTAAFKKITQHGSGVIVYMRQSLPRLNFDKLNGNGAKKSKDSHEDFSFLPDLRHYGLGAQILVDLGIKNIRLLTNNPRKIVGLDGFGLSVKERVSLPVDLAQKI